MASLSNDFSRKVNNEKFEDKEVQDRVHKSKELVHNIFEKEGNVFIPTYPIAQNHHIVTKFSKEGENYYITRFDTGLFAKKTGLFNFSEDGMPITYDTVTYKLKPENVKEFIDHTIEGNYIKQIGGSKKTLNSFKEKSKNLSKYLGEMVESKMEKGVMQRIGNCNTRSIRIACREMLPQSNFRQVFNIITNIDYEETLSQLQALKQELASKLHKKVEVSAVDDKLPDLPTKMEQTQYLLQATNNEINRILKFPSNIKHLNNHELQSRACYQTDFYGNNPKAYQILAKDAAKDLIRRGIITKGEKEEPVYPSYKGTERSMLEEQAIFMVPHDGNTPERLDMIYQACTNNCIEYSVNQEDEHVSKLKVEVKDIMKKAVETKYRDHLKSGNIIFTDKMIYRSEKPIRNILSQARKEGYTVSVKDRYSKSEQMLIADPKYIQDNKEKFIEQVINSLPDKPMLFQVGEAARNIVASIKAGNYISNWQNTSIPSAKDPKVQEVLESYFEKRSDLEQAFREEIGDGKKMDKEKETVPGPRNFEKFSSIETHLASEGKKGAIATFIQEMKRKNIPLIADSSGKPIDDERFNRRYLLKKFQDKKKSKER